MNFSYMPKVNALKSVSVYKTTSYELALLRHLDGNVLCNVRLYIHINFKEFEEIPTVCLLFHQGHLLHFL